MSTIHFVYQWENKRNGKIYIGSHSGAIDDGYSGSGVHFKRAYALEPNQFVRTIIKVLPDADAMREFEHALLTEVNAAENPNYYNLTNLASGGNLHSHLTDKERSEIYKKCRDGSKEWFANASSDDLAKLRDKKQESWKKSPKLEVHRERTKDRRLREEANKSDHDKEAFKEKCKESYWSRPADVIETHHLKQSEGLTEFYRNNPEARALRSKRMSESRAGRIFIKRDGTTKSILPEHLDAFLLDGWVRGRAKKKS